MSGAFHTFSGLKNTNLISIRNKPAKARASEPCLYKHHFDIDKGFRLSENGSCVDCSTSPTFSLDLDRLRPEAKRRAIHFWSQVDIEEPGDCWKYNEINSKSSLLHFWRRPELKSNYSFHPIRVAIWLSWGDFGNDATVSLCGERRCCNPLHNLPASMDDAIHKELNTAYLEGQVELLREQLQDHHREVAANKLITTNNDLIEVNKIWGSQDKDSDKRSLLSVQIDKALGMLKDKARI